jgi:hypothetical protein
MVRAVVGFPGSGALSTGSGLLHEVEEMTRKGVETMTGIFNMAKSFMLKGLTFFFQVFLATFHWLTRFFRLRLCGWKKCRAQKELDRAMRELGAEVYFLSDREGDWRNAPAVRQQLTRVREAEGKALAAEELSGAINRKYTEKRDSIKARYAERRARIGTSSGSDVE